MAHVDKHRLLAFLREAREALEAAKSIVSGVALDEFMADIRSRYALRYSLILLVEALTDAVTLILEAVHGVAPESYRDAMLLAGEKGLLPYRVARVLASLASLRNMLVHRYWRVDDERVYTETRESLRVVEEALEALHRYVEALDP